MTTGGEINLEDARKRQGNKPIQYQVVRHSPIEVLKNRIPRDPPSRGRAFIIY